jgi:hypothetical protein
MKNIINKVSPPSRVIGCTAKSLEAFQLVNSHKDGPMERVITDDIRWKAPKNGFVKINWSIAFADKSIRNMGIIVSMWLLEMVRERCWRLW